MNREAYAPRFWLFPGRTSRRCRGPQSLLRRVKSRGHGLPARHLERSRAAAQSKDLKRWTSYRHQRLRSFNRFANRFQDDRTGRSLPLAGGASHKGTGAPPLRAQGEASGASRRRPLRRGRGDSHRRGRCPHRPGKAPLPKGGIATRGKRATFQACWHGSEATHDWGIQNANLRKAFCFESLRPRLQAGSATSL